MRKTSRIAFSLAATTLGGENADGLTEVYYLLTPARTSDTEAAAGELSYYIAASRRDVIPSPSPSPTPTPSAVAAVAPGMLVVIRSNSDALRLGNEAQVQRDYQALLNLTFFDKTKTRVLTEDGARGGVIVVFEVVELPVIRELTFKGLKSLGEADMLKEFREQKVGVSKETTLDPVKVNNARRVIRELLAQRGHPNATVEVQTEEVSPTSVSVTFDVDESDRVRVIDIDFEGNKHFSDGELRGAMKLVKEAGLITRLKGEDILHLEKLDYDLRKNVRDFMMSKGYLDARTGEPRVEGLGPKHTGLSVPLLPVVVPMLSSTDEGLRVVIPINEGKRYRVGKVTLHLLDQVLRRGHVPDAELRPAPELLQLPLWLHGHDRR